MYPILKKSAWSDVYNTRGRHKAVPIEAMKGKAWRAFHAVARCPGTCFEEE